MNYSASKFPPLPFNFQGNQPPFFKNNELIKHIILVSGISGSGKTTAIRFLEDIGYYCVDNLPVNLIAQFFHEINQQNSQNLNPLPHHVHSALNINSNDVPETNHLNPSHNISSQKEYIAIGVDIRTNALETLPAIILELKQYFNIDCLFLDASDDILLKRFAQTRRKHPSSQSFFDLENLSEKNTNPYAHDKTTSELEYCLQIERQNLFALQEVSYRIDTSNLQAAELKTRLQQWLSAQINTNQAAHLLISIQSFGFKYGPPSDCDFIFDARHLPNPYYDEKLRLLTGLDQPVIDFLAADKNVHNYLKSIEQFIASNLKALSTSDRAYLTIGIGCTGGQHRSVYLAEQLAQSIKNMQAPQKIQNLQVIHRCISWHLQ